MYVFRLLIGEHLTDAFTDRNAGTLQLHHADRYAVDIQHHIGTLAGLVVIAKYGDFFRNIKIIVRYNIPVDIMHRGTVAAFVTHSLQTVSKERIHGFIGFIKCADLVGGFGGQLGDRPADLVGGIAAFFQVLTQQILTDGRIIYILQIAEEGIA